MRYIISLISLISILPLHATLENVTCKKCHPIIYSEYENSMHSKSSIFSDPVHKAVWNKHPYKLKGKYKCAKCHTPSDHKLMEGKTHLTKNQIQLTEPISCQTCHTIKSIKKHARMNSNIFTKEKKYFFSADNKKKGEKIEFKSESSLFGLIKRTTGSPYHKIDYSNENFYNGDMCLGCHDHKKNGKGLLVCDMQIKKDPKSKDTCISCHMPKIKGSFVNLKDTHTHAFHGISIHNSDLKLLSEYIKLSLNQTDSGFEVDIKNLANHTLFPQPLRVNQLRVTIERAGKVISLKRKNFVRIIGKNGKPAMPWIADRVLKDTLIKAHEIRKIKYNTKLQKGDSVVVEFGYYLVNPKALKKLNIKDKSLGEFIILTEKRFSL